MLQSQVAGVVTKKYCKMDWLWPNKKGAQKSVTLNVKAGCDVEAKKKPSLPKRSQPPRSQTMAVQEGRELQR